MDIWKLAACGKGAPLACRSELQRAPAAHAPSCMAEAKRKKCTSITIAGVAGAALLHG